MKDLTKVHKAIEDCRSGKIKYFILYTVDYYDGYFQFINEDDQTIVSSSSVNRDVDWKDEGFDELPFGFSEDKKIYYSLEIPNIRLEVCQPNSISKELLEGYINFVEEEFIDNDDPDDDYFSYSNYFANNIGFNGFEVYGPGTVMIQKEIWTFDDIEKTIFDDLHMNEKVKLDKYESIIVGPYEMNSMSDADILIMYDNGEIKNLFEVIDGEI